MRHPTVEGIILSTGFKRLRVNARIGAYEDEKLHSQEIFVSLSIKYSPQRIKVLQSSDRLENAHDYALAATLIQDHCSLRHYELLENLGLELLVSLQRNFPDCRGLDLEIEKPAAMPNADYSLCKLSWTC